MSTYVTADIHGEKERFEKLLELIGFSAEDELYIVGDVVDRGEDGIPVLCRIMRTENMHLILGNHDHMCLRYYAQDVTEKERRRWDRNRNFYTKAGLDTLTCEERQAVFDFLASRPDHLELTVGGRNYCLVHGFWADDSFDRIWNRPKIDTPSPFTDGTRLIIGHTPVCEYVCPGTDEDQYVYSRKLTESGDHFRILHAEGFIDLDCCSGYSFSAGRLACLRLEDGAEFYA